MISVAGAFFHLRTGSVVRSVSLSKPRRGYSALIFLERSFCFVGKSRTKSLRSTLLAAVAQEVVFGNHDRFNPLSEESCSQACAPHFKSSPGRRRTTARQTAYASFRARCLARSRARFCGSPSERARAYSDSAVRTLTHPAFARSAFLKELVSG